MIFNGNLLCAYVFLDCFFYVGASLYGCIVGLRLLPYVMPQIPGWKRRMLREKDLTETLEQASLG